MSLNPRLADFTEDPLYHFGLNKDMSKVEDPELKEKPLEELFDGTKIVCMGGSSDRMERFARRLIRDIPELGLNPHELTPKHIGKTERFKLFKIGPLVSVSHGMGLGSIRIALHELIKLLFYAGGDTRRILDDVKFIRIGTSGGIGVDLGQVVLSQKGIHSRSLQPVDEIYRVGETLQYPAVFDPHLLKAIHASRGDIDVVIGDTLTSNCFYEEEPNTHGALDGYTEEQLQEDLSYLIRMGVRNVEMEATALAGICGRAGVAAANVCTVIDPIGVPIKSTTEELAAFSNRAQTVVVRYIRSRLDELLTSS